MPLRHLGVTGQPRRSAGVREEGVDLVDSLILVPRHRPDPPQPGPQTVHGGQFGGVMVAAAGPAVAGEVDVQGGQVAEVLTVDPIGVDQDTRRPQSELGVMTEKRVTHDLSRP